MLNDVVGTRLIKPVVFWLRLVPGYIQKDAEFIFCAKPYIPNRVVSSHFFTDGWIFVSGAFALPEEHYDEPEHT
jgi:hypothetical protein